MPSKVQYIDIPETDIWTTLFSRKSKPFPDSQSTKDPPPTSFFPPRFPPEPLLIQSFSNLPRPQHWSKLHLRYPPHQHNPIRALLTDSLPFLWKKLRPRHLCSELH